MRLGFHFLSLRKWFICPGYCKKALCLLPYVQAIKLLLQLVVHVRNGKVPPPDNATRTSPDWKLRLERISATRNHHNCTNCLKKNWLINNINVFPNAGSSMLIFITSLSATPYIPITSFVLYDQPFFFYMLPFDSYKPMLLWFACCDVAQSSGSECAPFLSLFARTLSLYRAVQLVLSILLTPFSRSWARINETLGISQQHTWKLLLRAYTGVRLSCCLSTVCRYLLQLYL